MKKQLFLTLLAFLFLTVSCKQTVENQTASWDANLQDLNSMSAKYPNFKPAIESIKQEAQSAWDAAQSVSDEKEKIKAMSAANTKASPQFIRDLKNFDKKANSIRDMAAKAAQMSTDHQDSDAAWFASQSGERAIQESKRQLTSASPSSSADANTIVASIMKNLNSAENRLKDVVKTAKDKKKEEKKAEDKKKNAEDEKKAKEEKKEAALTCSYCKTQSPAGSSECGKCGASLPN